MPVKLRRQRAGEIQQRSATFMRIMPPHGADHIIAHGFAPDIIKPRRHRRDILAMLFHKQPKTAFFGEIIELPRQFCRQAGLAHLPHKVFGLNKIANDLNLTAILRQGVEARAPHLDQIQ